MRCLLLICLVINGSIAGNGTSVQAMDADNVSLALSQLNHHLSSTISQNATLQQEKDQLQQQIADLRVEVDRSRQAWVTAQNREDDLPGAQREIQELREALHHEQLARAHQPVKDSDDAWALGLLTKYFAGNEGSGFDRVAVQAAIVPQSEPDAEPASQVPLIPGSAAHSSAYLVVTMPRNNQSLAVGGAEISTSETPVRLISVNVRSPLQREVVVRVGRREVRVPIRPDEVTVFDARTLEVETP